MPISRLRFDYSRYLCLPALWLTVVLAYHPALAEKLTLVVPTHEEVAGKHMRYFPQLLKLALSKTEATDGAFELKQYPYMLDTPRAISELKHGGLDVIWTMTSAEWENTLMPVRIPLLRGLASHRVFLIRAQDQEKFSGVQSLEDLKSFRGGIGELWPDADVMEANGLPIVKSPHYELLFNMLAADRFDYFSRGLYEIWEEYAMHASKGLTIEESLMLHYHGPIYFFVNRDNPELAARIERGLRVAVEDGSFEKLFMEVPGFRWGMKELESKTRKKFKLTSPPLAE